MLKAFQKTLMNSISSRNLDALVAEIIFGWNYMDLPKDYITDNRFIEVYKKDNKILVDCKLNASTDDIILAMYTSEVPRYSIHLEKAFEIVDKLSTYGFRIIRIKDQGKYFATFTKIVFDNISKNLSSIDYIGISENPGVAICLAGLKSKGIDTGAYEK